MNSLNKTQFKIIYKMYNHNEYNVVLTNGTEIEQAAKMAEKLPEVFKFSFKGFREAWLIVDSLESLMKLIQYNRKHETL